MCCILCVCVCVFHVPSTLLKTARPLLFLSFFGIYHPSHPGGYWNCRFATLHPAFHVGFVGIKLGSSGSPSKGLPTDPSLQHPHSPLTLHSGLIGKVQNARDGGGGSHSRAYHKGTATPLQAYFSTATEDRNTSSSFTGQKNIL